jgi:hypothetical protein
MSLKINIVINTDETLQYRIVHIPNTDIIYKTYFEINISPEIRDTNFHSSYNAPKINVYSALSLQCMLYFTTLSSLIHTLTHFFVF